MNKTRINPQDISVVVQGAIAGSKTSKPKDRHTEICLKSIRKHLPGATIILSTWVGSDVEGLDYDALIESADPGSNMMGDYKSNCFRQVVSSINGLKACKTKYAIKIRSDLEFKNSDFLNYFIEFNNLPFAREYKVLKQRVVTLTTCNPARRYKYPYTTSDWFFFGLTEDLIDIFDIPLITTAVTKDNGDGNSITVANPFFPEQYIWVKFLSKYKTIDFKHSEDVSNDNLILTERYLANNCILLNAGQIKINWLKNPGGAYAQMPSLSNSGLYTFNEYKGLLNKYANNNLFIVLNPVEELTYFIVYNLRHIIKKLYMKILQIRKSS